MDLKGKKIILASGSPRRKELLASLNIEFQIDTRNSFEESFDENIPHTEIPVLMSKGKSYGFHRELSPDEILITADTMVLLDKVIMGKPHNRDEAIAMLKMLAGKTHEVSTGVTIRTQEKEISFTDTTYVEFCNLSNEEICYYIDMCKPFDKAGAYGIQEWIGHIGIKSINGSYFNVVGLPIHKVYETLKSITE